MKKNHIIPIFLSAIIITQAIPTAKATEFSVLPAYTYQVQPAEFQQPIESKKMAEHGMIEFESLKVENTGLLIKPGERNEKIRELKNILQKHHLVSHTQLKGENITLYDGKLKTLVHTLGQFCSYDTSIGNIDDSIVYIITHLDKLSADMLSDIKLEYKKKLIAEGTDGTIGNNGSTDGYYLFTQTDPEWGHLTYGKKNATIASSACGPASMSIILSSYFHKEILPTEIATFSVSRGHRYQTGTATSLFTDAAKYYGMPTPEEVYHDSVDAIYNGIRDEGHMAIALMGRGCFTGRGHYVALVGTEERDGKEYFKVSDPNHPNRSHKKSSRIIDENPADSFVLAEKSIFKKEIKNISWFKCDFKEVHGEYKTTKDEILLADYTDEEFLSMIPVAVFQSVSKDSLDEFAEKNQNDTYAANIQTVIDTPEVYAMVANQSRISF